MSASGAADVWAIGAAYEPYVGRWSRLVAREVLPWLEIGPGQRWLDVGCGTGILTRTILELVDPSQVVGVDPSDGFLAYARGQTADPRARFEPGDARALPFEADAFDAVVALDLAARDLDEGRRFPMCEPRALTDLFEAAGLGRVEVRAVDVPTNFSDFDDYWSPFLAGQGPAPGYVASLDEARCAALREGVRAALPVAPDGSIHLIARAWAIRGVPGTRAT